jgi:hypothetical protein
MMNTHVARPSRATLPVFEFSYADRPYFELEPTRYREQERLPDASPASGASVSSTWTSAEMADLAQHFLEQSAPLVDVASPPAWEDDDDDFRGELFAEEVAEQAMHARCNLGPAEKRDILCSLMQCEFRRYRGDSDAMPEEPLALLGLALTYRRLLLDGLTDPEDKREILKRLYTEEEPEWMAAEISFLHCILLDQCKYLSRASANLDRKIETLQWIYTEPWLEDKPFSFKNCVRVLTGNPAGFGEVYTEFKESLGLMIRPWIKETRQKKVLKDRGQADLFD